MSYLTNLLSSIDYASKSLWIICNESALVPVDEWHIHPDNFMFVGSVTQLLSVWHIGDTQVRRRSRRFVGFGRTPLRDKEIFWSNSCWDGAEFGEVNHLGWHEKGVGVVETGLEELSLKWVCASRVWWLKKVIRFFGQENEPPSGQSWICHCKSLRNRWLPGLYVASQVWQYRSW